MTRSWVGVCYRDRQKATIHAHQRVKKKKGKKRKLRTEEKRLRKNLGTRDDIVRLMSNRGNNHA